MKEPRVVKSYRFSEAEVGMLEELSSHYSLKPSELLRTLIRDRHQRFKQAKQVKEQV